MSGMPPSLPGEKLVTAFVYFNLSLLQTYRPGSDYGCQAPLSGLTSPCQFVLLGNLAKMKRISTAKTTKICAANDSSMESINSSRQRSV
jgi:hypothetical protein